MDPPEAVKVCPECGASIGRAATICRHCGYVFPSGGAVDGAPTGLTRQLAGDLRTRSSATDWLRLVAPLVIIVAVLGLAGAFYVRQRVTSTWDYAARHLPPRQSYDDGRL